MESYHNPEISLHGASIMATLANMDPSSHDLLMEVESYATMITMVTEYEDNKAIRTTCFSYLQSIFADKTHCLKICHREGLPFLVHGLEKKKHEKLISYLNVLTTVFNHSLSKKIIINCGVLEKLFSIFRKNAEEAPVIAAALQLLTSLLKNPEVIPIIVQMDYLGALIWCCDHYQDSQEVCIEVVTVFSIMATYPAVRAEMVAKKCVDAVFKMEELFKENDQFPGIACEFFTNLCDNALINERLGSAGIFDFLLQLLNHPLTKEFCGLPPFLHMDATFHQ